MRCSLNCPAKVAAASRSSSAPPLGWARPTRCCRRPMPSCARVSRCWQPWSRPTAGRKPKRCLQALRSSRCCVRSTAGSCSKKWTWMACSRPRRNWPWSTNWPTATPRAAAMPSAGRTCRSCWRRVSTSTPQSTSSTWKASMTRCVASLACRCARLCPIGCCRKPSNWC
ncbi:hypothetical protein D3C76_1204250 [compost metagenome]